jgi:hypothetical protein
MPLAVAARDTLARIARYLRLKIICWRFRQANLGIQADC